MPRRQHFVPNSFIVEFPAQTSIFLLWESSTTQSVNILHTTSFTNLLAPVTTCTTIHPADYHAMTDVGDIQVCKKCAQLISEVHAYELGDDRWHIHCFKCSKCDSSLGCNSNFLVLGNGSLICSNCSYNCKQCNKKIDDLAILTGDQAYCLLCFQCRVCKLKIEDLRYARTSKGLFCMTCHQKLIAKKRKYDMKRRQMSQLEQTARPAVDDSGTTDLDVYLNSNMSNLSNTSTTSLASVFKEKVLPHTPGSNTPVATAAEIEEVNDLDDELALRRARERLERRFDRLQKNPLPDTGVPMDLSSTISGSLTPSTVHTATDAIDTTPVRSPFKSPRRSPWDEKRDFGRFAAPSVADEINASTDTVDEVSFENASDVIGERYERSALDNKSDRSVGHDNKSDRSTATSARRPNGLYLDDAEALNTLAKDTNGNSGEPKIVTPTISSSNGHVSTHNSHEKPSNNTPLLMPTADMSLEGRSIHLLSPNALDEFDDIPRRSGASSPMAKANRHARVLESHDDIGASEISTEAWDVPLLAAITTPKKNVTTPQMALPPPRLALPEIPSAPSTPDHPRGLGLEGVDLRPRPMAPPTPTVTNLEDTIIDNSEVERTPVGRRTTRPKILLKHKRSISGGLNSGLSGKFGFFKSKEEERGHTRHVLEGSIHNLAYTTPPLPLSSPMRGVFRDHMRSTSDTPFVVGADAPNDHFKVELEMRSLKLDINQLEHRRQGLLADNVKLNTDKNKLQEAVRALLKKLSTEKETHEQLLRDINDLVAEKKKLRELNQQLMEDNDGIVERNKENKRRDRPLEKAKLNQRIERTRSDNDDSTLRHENSDSTSLDKLGLSESTRNERALSIIAERWTPVQRLSSIDTPDHNSGSSSSITNDQTDETSAETNKATRLKFWKKPKVTISPVARPITNGVPNSQSSYKLSQSYSSNAIQHPSQLHDDSGARKALNFMSKSRSTMVLDLLMDVPLFSSTIQKRADYENEKIPLIITRCLEEVEKRGLDAEGVYRISGGNSAIVAIENAFGALTANLRQDKRQMARLNDVMDGDINAVASALKRYLRKLPDPLIPFSVYDDFVRVGLNSTALVLDRCAELISRVINKLPVANKHVLYMLCKHLDIVNYYNGVNRMTFKNLSVVFAPTIARDKTGEKEMIDMGPRNEATEFLFSNFAAVFVGYEVI